MMPLLRWTLLLVVLAGAPACGFQGEGEIPAPTELYGKWANEEAGKIRVFEFAATLADAELAGLSDVYTVHVYYVGETPELAERGTYRISGERLVTTVVWSEDDQQHVGNEFTQYILGFTESCLVLQRDRIFDKVDAYPQGSASVP